MMPYVIADKVESKFFFKKEFENENGKVELAVVCLDINYRNKTYDITPRSSHTKEFKFMQTSCRWKMWKAVLDCISHAISFANKELCIKETEG